MNTWLRSAIYNNQPTTTNNNNNRASKGFLGGFWGSVLMGSAIPPSARCGTAAAGPAVYERRRHERRYNVNNYFATASLVRRPEHAAGCRIGEGMILRAGCCGERCAEFRRRRVSHCFPATPRMSVARLCSSSSRCICRFLL